MKAALALRLRRWQDRRAPASARVRLDHKRVYILPSRTGCAYGATLLLILLAAINYQNSLAYALVFVLGSLFMAAMLHTFRNLSGLEVTSATPPPVFAGEQALFGVLLESSGKAHQAIWVGFAGQAAQRVSVAPGQAARLELPLPSTRRGWLDAPRVRLYSEFPLGLLHCWSWVRGGQRALVYPQPLPGELPRQLGAASSDEAEGLLLTGPGADDFQGLNEYQPGDLWRRVHWKAWSRGGPLLVKTFAQASGQDLTLDFDTLEGDLEARLGLLCFWVLALCEQQRPFTLRLPGQHWGPSCDEAQRSACLRALALFEVRP